LFKRRPWGIAGAVILLIVLLLAASAPLVAPYGANEVSLVERLAPPGGGHLMGTDNLGRDVLSRILYGARPYALAALIAAGTAFITGAVSGSIAAVLPKNAADALGVVLFAVSLLAAAGLLGYTLQGVSLSSQMRADMEPVRALTQALFGNRALVVAGVLTGLALVPGAFMTVRRAWATPGTVALAFLVLMVVDLCMALGVTLLVLAPLGYYGFGITPPTPEWGGMLSSSGRAYMQIAPWMGQLPSIAIAITLAGVVLLGSAVPEMWVPRFVRGRAATKSTG
jgi:ABC-type dipeptide/oligopeptide/nickel transport system permease subunit